MKQSLAIFLFFISLSSCQKIRQKDFQEVVLSELVHEKNGYYYTSDAHHNDKEFTGECRFYYESGKVKGNAIIKNGTPDGHWEYWNEDGSKKSDLYYENGIVVRRIVQIIKR